MSRRKADTWSPVRGVRTGRVAVLLFAIGILTDQQSAFAQLESQLKSERLDAAGGRTEAAPPWLPSPSKRCALIVIGLAGDAEHRERFQQTADIWRRWLVQVAGVEEQDLFVLCSNDATEETPPATSASVSRVLETLNERLGPSDGLWVFLLGHGSQDERHGWFHLPGADLNAVEWGGLFAQLQAQEQVFWLTHAASGTFIKPLSSPGRIVIAATDADGEVNETRFPHLLAELMKEQLDATAAEGSVQEPPPIESAPDSVLSLFLATTQRVHQAFAQTQLLPTEHAQLDDNGDGLGTEDTDLAAAPYDTAPYDAAPYDTAPYDTVDSFQTLVDGPHARRVLLKLPPKIESKATAPAANHLPSSTIEPKP